MPEKHDGLPDSWRPSGLCPRCNKQSSFEIIGYIPLTFDGGTLYGQNGKQERTHCERAAILICRHCQQGVSVLEAEWIGDTRRLGGRTPSSGPVTWRGFQWWPLPTYQSHEAIPSDIGEALSEAQMALAANCPRASAVMARRTLEAIADDKGQTTGPLAHRLKNLADAGILQPTLAEWAKEVRLLGNAGAHYDPINKVSMEDAQQLIKFVEALLNYVYIMPADLKHLRNSR